MTTDDAAITVLAKSQVERSRSFSITRALTNRSRAITEFAKPQVDRSRTDHASDHANRSRFPLPL
jgi:hypothetical protein